MENYLQLIPMVMIAGIPLATPVLLAALGGVFMERSGILNLGLEGLLLMGAVVAALITVSTGEKMLGVTAAFAVCCVLGLVHAWLTISMKGNQIVAGLAMVLFGNGVSIMIGKPVIGRPMPDTFSRISIPVLSEIPFIGPLLFHHDALTYGTLLLVPALWWLMYQSIPGMNLRAVGEDPATADSLGISVKKTRYLTVILGSGLAGVGGAFLSLAHTPSWMEGMSAGKGWIAIAIIVFAAWNPAKAFVGAYLYGIIQALSLRLQIVGIQIPSQFLNMLPYLMPIVVLIIMMWKNPKQVDFPAAIGKPYEREQR